MDTSQLYTVLITLITVLGSAGAWRYFDNRAKTKEKSENFMKDDCRERIRKMEILLERSSLDKEEMRKEILKLTAEVSELRVKVEFLERENLELIRSNKNIK